MNILLIQETARRVHAGTLAFPEVVSELMRAGVEYYHVDYIGRRKTFYSADGVTVSTTIDYPDLPPVEADFEAPAVKAAILDSQRHRQTYHAFSRRVMAAGVQGYFAFLRGKRVSYFGRQGDQHIEWFPGAEPAARPAFGKC